MVWLELKSSASSGQIDKANDALKKPGAHTFILFYMEGCGPCNATRPEWAKLQNVLSNDFLKRDDVAVVTIDQVLASKLENAGGEPNSFPTMRYIHGKTVENYEDASVPEEKDRTIDSFVAWIKAKTGEDAITTSEPTRGGGRRRSRKSRRQKRLTKRHKRFRRHTRHKRRRIA